MPGERFSNLKMIQDGGSPQRVTVEVGMEGFNVLGDGGRALKKYPLHHISRWSMRGTSLILFTRSPVDVEDRTLTLQGDEHAIRSVLDMLTCSCMQMAELLESGQAGAQGTSSSAAAHSLNALLKKSKKPTLLTADQVEFWRSPEKEGWMYSQGEHIKTWRKRWFVLKQGFLFRFADTNVTASSKPRGIVDLTTVTDVTDGTSTTGRPNSIRLSTATGGISYLTENETAQVEWISALEGTVARLVRSIAGIDDEQPSRPSSLADQLMKSYNSASGGGGSGNGHHSTFSSSSGRHHHSSKSKHSSRGGDGMIRIVNYEGGGASGASPSSNGGGGEYINIDYGSVAGAHQMPNVQQSAPPVQYGGAGYSNVYPTLANPPQQQTSMYQQQPSYAVQPQQAAPPQNNTLDPTGSGGYGYSTYQQPPVQPDYGAAASQHPGMQQQQQGMSLFDAVTAPAVPPPAPTSPWQTHYTQDGRPYYYNSSTGITSWEAPNA